MIIIISPLPSEQVTFPSSSSTASHLLQSKTLPIKTYGYHIWYMYPGLPFLTIDIYLFGCPAPNVAKKIQAMWMELSFANAG